MLHIKRNLSICGASASYCLLYWLEVSESGALSELAAYSFLQILLGMSQLRLVQSSVAIYQDKYFKNFLGLVWEAMLFVGTSSVPRSTAKLA